MQELIERYAPNRIPPEQKRVLALPSVPRLGPNYAFQAQRSVSTSSLRSLRNSLVHATGKDMNAESRAHHASSILIPASSSAAARSGLFTMERMDDRSNPGPVARALTPLLHRADDAIAMADASCSSLEVAVAGLRRDTSARSAAEGSLTPIFMPYTDHSANAKATSDAADNHRVGRTLTNSTSLLDASATRGPVANRDAPRGLADDRGAPSGMTVSISTQGMGSHREPVDARIPQFDRISSTSGGTGSTAFASPSSFSKSPRRHHQPDRDAVAASDGEREGIHSGGRLYDYGFQDSPSPHAHHRSPGGESGEGSSSGSSSRTITPPIQFEDAEGASPGSPGIVAHVDGDRHWPDVSLNSSSGVARTAATTAAAAPRSRPPSRAASTPPAAPAAAATGGSMRMPRRDAVISNRRGSASSSFTNRSSSEGEGGPSPHLQPPHVSPVSTRHVVAEVGGPEDVDILTSSSAIDTYDSASSAPPYDALSVEAVAATLAVAIITNVPRSVLVAWRALLEAVSLEIQADLVHASGAVRSAVMTELGEKALAAECSLDLPQLIAAYESSKAARDAAAAAASAVGADAARALAVRPDRSGAAAPAAAAAQPSSKSQQQLQQLPLPALTSALDRLCSPRFRAALHAFLSAWGSWMRSARGEAKRPKPSSSSSAAARETDARGVKRPSGVGAAALIGTGTAAAANRKPTASLSGSRGRGSSAGDAAGASAATSVSVLQDADGGNGTLALWACRGEEDERAAHEFSVIAAERADLEARVEASRLLSREADDELRRMTEEVESMRAALAASAAADLAEEDHAAVAHASGSAFAPAATGDRSRQHQQLQALRDRAELAALALRAAHRAVQTDRVDSVAAVRSATDVEVARMQAAARATIESIVAAGSTSWSREAEATEQAHADAISAARSAVDAFQSKIEGMRALAVYKSAVSAAVRNPLSPPATAAAAASSESMSRALSSILRAAPFGASLHCTLRTVFPELIAVKERGVSAAYPADTPLLAELIGSVQRDRERARLARAEEVVRAAYARAVTTDTTAAAAASTAASASGGVDGVPPPPPPSQLLMRRIKDGMRRQAERGSKQRPNQQQQQRGEQQQQRRQWVGVVEEEPRGRRHRPTGRVAVSSATAPPSHTPSAAAVAATGGGWSVSGNRALMSGPPSSSSKSAGSRSDFGSRRDAHRTATVSAASDAASLSSASLPGAWRLDLQLEGSSNRLPLGTRTHLGATEMLSKLAASSSLSGDVDDEEEEEGEGDDDTHLSPLSRWQMQLQAQGQQQQQQHQDHRRTDAAAELPSAIRRTAAAATAAASARKGRVQQPQQQAVSASTRAEGGGSGGSVDPRFASSSATSANGSRTAAVTPSPRGAIPPAASFRASQSRSVYSRRAAWGAVFKTGFGAVAAVRQPQQQQQRYQQQFANTSPTRSMSPSGQYRAGSSRSISPATSSRSTSPRPSHSGVAATYPPAPALRVATAVSACASEEDSTYASVIDSVLRDARAWSMHGGVASTPVSNNSAGLSSSSSGDGSASEVFESRANATAAAAAAAAAAATSSLGSPVRRVDRPTLDGVGLDLLRGGGTGLLLGINGARDEQQQQRQPGDEALILQLLPIRSPRVGGTPSASHPVSAGTPGSAASSSSPAGRILTRKSSLRRTDAPPSVSRVRFTSAPEERGGEPTSGGAGASTAADGTSDCGGGIAADGWEGSNSTSGSGGEFVGQRGVDTSFDSDDGIRDGELVHTVVMSPSHSE